MAGIRDRLLGRSRECEVLDRLLDAVRSGDSRTVVVLGEEGIGKSTLLAYVADRAADCRVVRAGGVQSETELVFAALHQLCTPLLDRLDRLPQPLRAALDTAFGVGADARPDPFLVGLAVLRLLVDRVDDRPLVCLVDDVQWIDRASARVLGFVARRLHAGSVALVFAGRDPGGADLAGLPHLPLGGLRPADARALLESVAPAPMDERVRDRVVAETRGNPLALVELRRGLIPAELTGGFALGASPLPGHLEERFRRRLARLAPETRRLVLVAAAEPTGDPVLVWRAAERLGVEVDAAGLAAAETLVEIGSTVRFRHPLARAAVYRAASPQLRQDVHAALAEATDPTTDPDRRVWHRAQASLGPDEDVAAELERWAGCARARGGLAAAAAFLERAAALTSELGHLGRRALAAAQAGYEAGARDGALDLLATARARPLGPLQRAREELLRAQIGLAADPRPDALAHLLRAARTLESLDIGLARHAYLDAFAGTTLVRSRPRTCGLREVAVAVRAAPSPTQTRTAADLLLDGLALAVTEGQPAGARVLKRALQAFRRDDVPHAEALRWLWFAGRVALSLWDDETWAVLTDRHVQLAREAGALAVLPLAMATRVEVHMAAGEMAEAASLLDEAEAVAEATGTQIAPSIRPTLLALKGRETEVWPSVDDAERDMVPRGDGHASTSAWWARAALANGRGRYEDALAALREGPVHPEDLWFSTWGLIETVEAAARSGDSAAARSALERLAMTTRATGTDLALGMEARTRALLSEGETADRLYREAIERLGRSRVRIELARTHLVYGEWLRRERRRRDARVELRTAHTMFTEMGLDAFAQRAEGELLATGETARKRTGMPDIGLTPQEARIARLASGRLSNPEIAARLYISPRTVEYHLRKVFTKLGITSRDQLRGMLPADPTAVAS